ncbi:hypothetical protein GCM10011519_27100 [Marmoricola endophyticus]|uniref:Glycosyltransferase 2-like domain-containing protein n=1 Tax=Marmoricola endophyticus TaxID=2040280 RepID=A0A917F6P5_9ACTN|nr:glycosyltransferase family 2 protein [Marmoricola endophyticus]GGF51662.1 hypothetical protein GCM10011519_27100 [Marmoricola endophyticus]
MRQAAAVGVTAVIPHYGSPAPALALVEQLLTQPTRHPLQVIVVDDRSPAPFPDRDDVTVLRRERNGGFGSAVNTGAREARHPLLLVLNSDLEVPSRFLDELVGRALPELPAVVAPNVSCGGRMTGGQRFPRARFQSVEWVSFLGRWQDARWFRRAIGKVDAPPAGGRVVVDWVAGEAMLMRTQDFAAVGGFDETYFMYAEEVDLQRRLHQRGVGSVVLGTTPVLHEGAASSDPALRASWLTTARLHYARTWGGLTRLRVGLSAASLVNAAVGAARRVAGRPTRPATELADQLARVWTRRRPQDRAT